jgi:hypothetical protein
MQRRTAIAAATAIAISLLSGVVAVGAHLGALGFAGTPAAPAAQPIAAATAPALVTDQGTSTVAPPERDHNHRSVSEDLHGENHESGASQRAANDASTTSGAHDD